MADEELERAIALVTRLRGLKIVGCVGGCDPRDVAMHPQCVRFAGDQWVLEACKRCLAGGARRYLLDELGPACADPKTYTGPLWLFGAWPTPHMVYRDTAGNLTGIADGSLRTLCSGRPGNLLVPDPVFALRALPVIARDPIAPAGPLAGCINCWNARAERKVDPAAQGPGLLGELRAWARRAVVEGGRDPAEVGL